MTQSSLACERMNHHRQVIVKTNTTVYLYYFWTEHSICQKATRSRSLKTDLLLLNNVCISMKHLLANMDELIKWCSYLWTGGFHSRHTRCRAKWSLSAAACVLERRSSCAACICDEQRRCRRRCHWDRPGTQCHYLVYLEQTEHLF